MHTYISKYRTGVLGPLFACWVSLPMRFDCCKPAWSKRQNYAVVWQLQWLSTQRAVAWVAKKRNKNGKVGELSCCSISEYCRHLSKQVFCIHLHFQSVPSYRKSGACIGEIFHWLWVTFLQDWKFVADSALFHYDNQRIAYFSMLNVLFFRPFFLTTLLIL